MRENERHVRTRAALSRRQTTVCKALDKLDSYRGDGPLLGWLYACCRNELRLGPKAAESLLTRARSAFRNAYDRLRAAPPAAADPLPFATSRTPRS